MARSTVKKSTKPAARADQPKLYTLDVFIIAGPIEDKFVKKNPVICRRIQIRGDQTLQELHYAIFNAFDRWEQHMYEFQFGRGPMDPKGKRYVLSAAVEGIEPRPTGQVDKTTIDSLRLRVGRRFGYWFDFGDDWWHQINVEAIEVAPAKGIFPKVIKKTGKSPPQYPEQL